jgi:hypothetical protein
VTINAERLQRLLSWVALFVALSIVAGITLGIR